MADPEAIRGNGDRKLEVLERRFLDFLTDAGVGRKAVKRHQGPAFMIAGQAVFLQWGDEALDPAVAAAQELCPFVSQRMAARALSDLVKELFVARAPSENAMPEIAEELYSVADLIDMSGIRPELVELVGKLKALQRAQLVFVPIEGLDLHVHEMRVATVTLHRHEDGCALDRALSNLTSEIGERSVNSILTYFRSIRCYAAVEAVGGDYFVREEAAQRTREAVNILNLYLSSSMHQPYWARMHVGRTIINEVQHKASERVPVGFSQSLPAERPLELDRERLQYIEQWGLADLSACFEPRNSGDIAKRIRRAVNWYGNAVDADSPEEKYVNLAIALESLLIGDEGKGPYATTGSISQKLGERVAFLLGDDFETRTEIQRTTKVLYGLRSAIVHHGKRVERSQLADMDNLVKQVILVFLRHSFVSWPAFQEWIARQRYGGNGQAAESTAQ